MFCLPHPWRPGQVREEVGILAPQEGSGQERKGKVRAWTERMGGRSKEEARAAWERVVAARQTQQRPWGQGSQSLGSVPSHRAANPGCPRQWAFPSLDLSLPICKSGTMRVPVSGAHCEG